MLKEEFLLHGATASTGGCAVFMVLNGPIRKILGCEKNQFNALGSSDRATSVIGRAIRLGLINILNVSPGTIDRSTLGHPGKISYCVAEDEEGTNLGSLAEFRGFASEISTVTVFAASSPRQIMNEWTEDPKEILDTYASEMKSNLRNYSIWSGNYAIVIPKQHRDHLEKAGWTRDQISQYLLRKQKSRDRNGLKLARALSSEAKEKKEYSALHSPEHLLIVAAGGPAGGFGAIIPPWLGTKSQAVTVAIGACVDCEPEL